MAARMAARKTGKKPKRFAISMKPGSVLGEYGDPRMIVHLFDGIAEVGFADDIVAIKNRASFPAGELHDGPFADSLVGHLTGEAAAQVVEGSVGLQDFDLRLEFRADLDGSDIAGEASFITGGLPGLAEFANSGKDGGVDGVLWFQTLKKALHFGTHGNDAARSVFVFPDIDADLSRFQVDVPPFEAFDFFESPAGEESEPYHLRQRRGE